MQLGNIRSACICLYAYGTGWQNAKKEKRLRRSSPANENDVLPTPFYVLDGWLVLVLTRALHKRKGQKLPWFMCRIRA